MEDFKLPVSYKGNEFSFPTNIIKQAYAQKFEVQVNGHPIIFEPDENGEYRAMLAEKDLDEHHFGDIGLLKEIAETLRYLVND